MMSSCSSRMFNGIIIGTATAIAVMMAALAGHVIFVIKRRRSAAAQAMSTATREALCPMPALSQPIPIFRVVLSCEADHKEGRICLLFQGDGDLRELKGGEEFMCPGQLTYLPDMVPVGEGRTAARALMPDGFTLCLAHPEPMPDLGMDIALHNEHDQVISMV